MVKEQTQAVVPPAVYWQNSHRGVPASVIQPIQRTLANLHAILFLVGDIIHPRMGLVTSLGQSFRRSRS